MEALSLSHGPMLKHSQSFLERWVRARLPQLDAGCWHRLSLFYLPFMARCSPCNKICGEAELGDGWEMSGGQIASACLDFS